MPDADLGRMARTIQAFHRSFGLAARDGEVFEAPGVVASIAPAIPFRSIFNAAAHETPDALAPVLPVLRDRYERAGVTAWGVWAHEDDSRAAELLTEAGLRIDSSPTAMVRSLGPEDAEFAPTLDVVRADELPPVDAALAAAYDYPPGVLPWCFPSLLERFRGFLARDERGEPAAAVVTVHRDGDCGFTMVGAAPAARRRGLVTELMRLALADACAAGCTTTTLQSTAMGRPVYERLGYRALGAYHLWELRTAPDPLAA
ncbi:MAG: hypothetical protein QOK31_1620 [Solirubrobacteraceae bacterium]|jgi:ribosomal protein S18 acetylase RimI-like enzyme|nr:hypothetical protein [Solirubrobacteraceae bacterium]